MPITVKEHIRERKSKSKRDDLYANLPVREVKLPLSEVQRRCEYCNSEMITFTHTLFGKKSESRLPKWNESV